MTEQTLAVQRMQDYIEEHLTDEITLADLARASLFSPWHAHRLFHQLTGFTPAENTVSLQDAQVIVAGGKGVGSRKGFDKLFRLAALLGGAVGATRSAVDAGYIGYAHQIGQTGVTVRPRLYIVFGASGAIQHTVGMSAAKTVIAVNRDRLAPIFRCADYGVAADWEETADEMISMLREQASVSRQKGGETL